MPSAIEEARQEVLIAADQAKEALREVWFRAKRANDPLDADSLRDELCGVVAGLKEQVPTADETDLENLKIQLDFVITQRAYLAPAESLAIEAQSKINAMMEWGIPEEVKVRMNALLQGITAPGATDLQRRFVLEQLYDEHNYWDRYKDWFLEESLNTLSRKFIKIFSWTLVASFIFFLGFGWSIIGFVLAGAAGASLSILLKLPPMTVYARAADHRARTNVRLLVGVATATIGYGLLAAGVINLGIPAGPSGQLVRIHSLAERCTGDFSLASIVERFTRRSAANAAPLAADPKDAKAVEPCNASGVMLLLAIGMLLGFSERALTSFESLFLPQAPPSSGPPRPKHQPPRGRGVPADTVAQQPDLKAPATADDRASHGARQAQGGAEQLKAP